MENFEQCATISEMFYQASQKVEQEEKVETQPEPIQFDVSFLLYLVPEEHEWIFEIMEKK